MSERNDFGAFLIGFVIGGLTGAVSALLLAPQSGEETRTFIKEKAIEMSDKATETVEVSYEKAEAAAEEARKRFEELAKATKERAEELQSRGQVILEEQKGKLSTVLKSKEASESEEGEAPAEAAA
jgi:gas vesicle protein